MRELDAGDTERRAHRAEDRLLDPGGIRRKCRALVMSLWTPSDRCALLLIDLRCGVARGRRSSSVAGEDTHAQRGIDWLDWLRRWDAQQEGYVPEREARFAAMLDALAELLPASFVALDLACGPGSISQRLLARFPRAQAIAVDIDPVMVAIGRGALGTVDGRLRWIEADLASPDWLEALGDTQLDAVLSTTALHWLEPEPLARLYHDLGRLLRPGGLLLNGDHMAFSSPTPARLSERVLDQQWADAAFAARGIETAEQWWDALGLSLRSRRC